jgi:hypothetical protein
MNYISKTKSIETLGTPLRSLPLSSTHTRSALAHIGLIVMASNSILLQRRSTVNVLRLGVRWSVETAALLLTRRMGRFIIALLATDL